MSKEQPWRITYRLPDDPEVIAEKEGEEPKGCRFTLTLKTEAGDELVIQMGEESRKDILESLSQDPQIEIIP